MSTFRRRLQLLAACAATVVPLIFAGASAGARYPGTGNHPWLIVLCNFADEPAQPYPQTYFQQLFANPGNLGESDYWNSVSFQQLSLAGTTVTPWVTARNPSNTTQTLTRNKWNNLTVPFTPAPTNGNARLDKIIACADGAPAGTNFGNYWGVAAIFVEARSSTGAAINATSTTVTLSTTANFPNGTVPFQMSIDDGSQPNGGNSETVLVTAVTGNTYTITRAQAGTTAQAHAAGARVSVAGDLGGVGAGQLPNIPLLGTNYTIATIVLPHEIDVEGASHEMGHGFGYDHSRKLSYSTTDYGDSEDLMSVYVGDDWTFSADPTASNFLPGSGLNFGPDGGFYNTVLGEAPGSKGPGLDAINLDKQGWIPGPRHYGFDNSVSNQTTITLHALGDAAARGAPAAEYLEATIPASITIENLAPNGANGAPLPPTTPPTCSGAGYGCTTANAYTLEYRERELGFDAGFAASGLFVHLLGADTRSYWVDRTPNGTNGELRLAGEYVDAANKTYVALNSIDRTTHTAQVTLGSRKINAQVGYTGDTSGDFNDDVTLAGNLTVAGSGAPVPLAQTQFTLGTQSCTPALTDASGHASCSIRLSQHPGTYSVAMSYAGDAAYATASTARTFTITREESAVAYSGALTSDYHDAFTASTTLVDPVDSQPVSGKAVTFTLGAGDTCTAATDGTGVAACSITPTQPAGTYTLLTSFAGDIDYEASSDSRSFVVTREETTTTYTGPLVIAAGQPVTLSASTLEDGTAAPAPAVTVTLSLGSQSCTATSDAAGRISCTLASVSVALGPQALAAVFAGDAYYLPSQDRSQQAIVFAFPSRGAFVIGDGGSGAATATWWSHSWASLNVLSGGAVNAAFKGFAANVTPRPPQCGGSWTTTGGNSAAPVETAPDYMGVVVASTITKSGSVFAGDVVRIVVVRTDPGYRPNPGSPGTGTIVATYCG